MRKQLCKLLSVLCVMTMLFAMLTPVHAAGVSLTVSGPSIEQGAGTTEADVTFTLSGNTGIAGVQLTMKYAEGLTLKKLTKGTALPSLTFTLPGDFTKNPVTLPWDGMEADDTNGIILTATFEVSKETVKDYDITVTPDEGGCYDGAVPPNDVAITVTSGKISITEKPKESFTGLSLADAEYTYDGTAKALEVKGAPADATVTYTSDDFDENGKAIKAGTYSITATVKKDGYNDWTDTKTLKINPKKLTIEGLKAQNKTYDGTDKATLSGGALDGVIKGDDVSAKMPTEGKFADKNAGDSKKVTISEIALSGDDAGNYTLALPALKANIAKAPISVKADDLSMTKGSALPTLTYTVTEGKKYEEDAVTGELATKANGKKTGSFDITQGTLKATSNYELSFTKGTLTVTDKKTQKVEISKLGDKTYGDAAFNIEITKDENSAFGEFTFTSKDPEIATVDKAGTVTILKAGKTEITVSRKAKDDAYADYSYTLALNVKRIAITVKAEAASKKIDTKDPELTYTYEPKDALAGGDKFAGALTRKKGEAIGKYDILQGDLKINDNYDITYIKATFEIVDKTPQTITVADFEEKTYGDSTFAISVTPDEKSKLDTFTYTSDNEKVATISEDGTITIAGAGEAKITATQAGDGEYAAASSSKTLKVNPKTVTVKSVDLANKTADLEGVLDKDNGKVALDFDKIKTTVTATETSTTDEVTTVTSTLKVTGFKLTGDKAGNYVAETKELTTTVSNTAISEKLTEDENTTITAAKADDKTIVVTDVTVTASDESEESTTITIDTTAIEGTEIEAVVFPKEVVASIASADNASLEIKVKDGNGNDATIVLNSEAVSAIQSAIGEAAATISISAVKTESEDLSAEQAAKVDEVSAKSPVVYSLSISDENGNSVASGFGESGTATVTLSYTKPSGNGTIIVVYLDNDGNTTSISNPKYDSTNNTITITLGHFSEYMIYTEPKKATTSGGGGGVPTYSVRFVTTGGSSIDSQKVVRNALATEPAAPVRAGYDFAGWYTDHELTTKYDFDTKVTKSLTLYAAWTENGTEKKDDNTEPTTPENKITFTDVKENYWFAENVKYVAENGLMNGVTNTEFAPNDNLTRAMLVAILYRAAGEPETNKSKPFADVAADSYYANAVIWAQQNGIVSGISETEFAPDENITREQIAAIIYRYAKLKDYDVSVGEDTNILSYTDANEISEYAIEAMQYAVGSGLMKGKTESTLNPKDNATRAEIAAILQRFIEANK